MVLKKITIILMPEGTKSLKQLRLPKLFLLLLLFFFFSFSVSFCWIIRDYQAMRKQRPQLALLNQENEQQKRHITYLTQRIDEIIAKMGELKEFDQKLKVMANLETEDEELSPGGVGGSGYSLTWLDSAASNPHEDQVRLMHHSLDNLNNEIAMLKRDKVSLQKFLENQKKLLASTPSIWPTKGWLSSGFGYRISPFTDEREFHKGIDISTRMNSPIVAPADGVVFGVDFDSGYGKTLVLKHGNGMATLYAHLQKILVKSGDYIKRGQEIALVGNTGRSTGPHLHYEVHLNGVPVDPRHYILN